MMRKTLKLVALVLALTAMVFLILSLAKPETRDLCMPFGMLLSNVSLLVLLLDQWKANQETKK